MHRAAVRRGLLVMAAAILALGLVGLTPATGAIGDAPALIEGDWKFGGGLIDVREVGEGHFEGTVRKPTKFADCVHPKGQKMWDIYATDNPQLFEGTHVGYNADCTELPGWAASFAVDTDETGEKDNLFLCVTPPGGGEETCKTLDRKGFNAWRLKLRSTARGKPYAASDGDPELTHPRYKYTRILANLKFSAKWKWFADPPQFKIVGKTLKENYIFIEDLFKHGFPETRDTDLEIIGLVDEETEVQKNSSVVEFKVKVSSSDWPDCPRKAKGTATFYENGTLEGKIVDATFIQICGRNRLYVSHAPTKKDRVNNTFKVR